VRGLGVRACGGEPAGVVYCHDCRRTRVVAREVYVSVGVFDDLEPFEPEVHNWVS
jgi:hypothetical protein